MRAMVTRHALTVCCPQVEEDKGTPMETRSPLAVVEDMGVEEARLRKDESVMDASYLHLHRRQKQGDGKR